MTNTNIVDLGRVRGLLAELDKVRQAVLAGKITDSREATRAMLKASVARALAEDEEDAEDDPLQFGSSR